MPDYLTSIAERTLGVAPVAQPLIAPLFAPKPALSVPESTFLTEEETLEAELPASSAGLSGAMPVSPHASSIARTAHQSVVSPVQSRSGRTDARAEPHQKNSPAHREQPSTNPLDAMIVTVATHDAPPFTNQKNDPARPELPASPSPAPKADMIQYMLPNARGFPPVSHEEAVAATTSHAIQTESLELHEHLVIAPAEQHVRATSSQPVKKPLRQASAENSQPEPAHAPVQFNVQGGASKDAQGVAPQRQVPPSRVDSVWRVPDVSALPENGTALPGEQDLLVPQRANGSHRMAEQSISRPQASSMAPAYEQDTSSTDARALTHVDPQQQSGGAKQHDIEQNMVVQSGAPTIRVTIGRIDVRAITPPAPTTHPKPARSGPTISLEDYARQTRGGR